MLGYGAHYSRSEIQGPKVFKSSRKSKIYQKVNPLNLFPIAFEYEFGEMHMDLHALLLHVDT
jgi:hypothetical protein